MPVTFSDKNSDKTAPEFKKAERYLDESRQKGGSRDPDKRRERQDNTYD